MYVTHMMPLYPSQDAYFGLCPHSKGVALTGTPLRLPTVVLIRGDFRHGWAIFGPLADKNTWKGVLLELPASEKFSGLFL